MDSHCIFPAHTKRDEAPANWPIITIREADLQEFYSRVYAGAEGTNLEQAERRKNLPEKTAILVYVGTKFVGIQAGIGPNFATFPVRKAAERINGGADMLAVYHCQTTKHSTPSVVKRDNLLITASTATIVPKASRKCAKTQMSMHLCATSNSKLST